MPSTSRYKDNHLNHDHLPGVIPNLRHIRRDIPSDFKLVDGGLIALGNLSAKIPSCFLDYFFQVNSDEGFQALILQ